MLHRWIISYCVEQGRNPPRFVRRRLERDAELRAYARRLSEIDDRLRHERPEPSPGRPIEFSGVSFVRGQGPAARRLPVGGWGIGALAAMVLIGVLIVVSSRPQAELGDEDASEGRITLAGEFQDLRADASLLGRRLLERIPRPPQVDRDVQAPITDRDAG